MLHNIVKSVFAIVGATLATMLIYYLLFIGDYSALNVMGNAMDYPIGAECKFLLVEPLKNMNTQLDADLENTGCKLQYKGYVGATRRRDATSKQKYNHTY